MHRYREFGLVSEEDELLRRAFRDGFKRAGLSFSQFLDALAWYRDHGRAASDEAYLNKAFAEFAANRGWPAEHRDGAIEVYRAIRSEGAAAMTDTAPSPEEDRARIAHSEEVLRSDPGRYWKDRELQDAVFEARERLGAIAQSTSAATPEQSDADRRQIEEIEALLHDPSGAGQRRYWNDDGLRTQYAQALARVHREAATPQDVSLAAAPPVPAATGDEGVLPKTP